MLYSSTYEAAVSHNIAFMKSRGGCPDLSDAPFPMYSLSHSDDISVYRFPFGLQQAGSRLQFNTMTIGRLRKRLSIPYHSRWTISLFHCQENPVSPNSVVAHVRDYKVFVSGNAEWVNPFGYASYDEYIPQVFVRTDRVSFIRFFGSDWQAIERA